MTTRRDFIQSAGGLLAGSLLMPHLLKAGDRAKKEVGIQLYSVRNEMLANPAETLIQLGKIGYNQIESARSAKGNYYGLTPKEIKTILSDHGMTLRSGHTHIDKDFQQSIDQAAEAGEQYLICAVLPSEGQTVDNYKKNAALFNKAGEQCKKSGVSFGYHNHEYEFEKENGQVFYDVLLDNVQPDLALMELDLGWVVATGNNPVEYFTRYPGRFPLWHLKDMDLQKKQSTEFGKGAVDIKGLLKNAKLSGMKYFFIEQEEYSHTPMESMEFDYNYLSKLDTGNW